MRARLVPSVAVCIVLWHGAAPAQDAEIVLKHASHVQSIAFSPGSKNLAVALESGDAIVWEIASAKRLVTLTGPKARPIGVAFAPDGKKLNVFTPDKHTIWEVPAGKIASKLNGCTFVAGTGVGRLEDGAVHYWRLDDGKGPPKAWRRPGAEWRKTGAEGRPFRPIVSADGAQAAVLFGSKLTILKLDTMTERASIDIDLLASEVESAAISPDNQVMAIGAQGGLRVWDIAGGGLRFLDEA